MRRIITALMILVTASSCYASDADENFRSANRGGLFHPDKSGDKELHSLITQYVPKFTTHTFSDDVTGLSIDYSIYVPENCSNPSEYPVVFFMADASAAGKEPLYSLTQGMGALVWCKDDCIVIVPSFPSVVLDDHDGFVESEYVELAGRFVKWTVRNYGLNESRVYATGQSMGCMTWLVLAARHPEMFTASMFVSGQWDINALKGLLSQKFVYIASAGDPKASAGLNEVAGMFRNSPNDGFSVFTEVDAKNPDVFLADSQPVYFVMFRKGTTLPDGAEGEYSEHMTSFDYAYRMTAARQWLLAQTKEDK